MRIANPPDRKPAELLWFALLGVGMLVGLFAFSYILINGHSHEFNAPWKPSWGILISTYELFVLLSVGLCLVGAIGNLAGLPGREAYMPRGVQVAALALFMGVGTVSIELTHPMRLTFDSLARREFVAAIEVSVCFYGLYLIWLGGEYLALLQRARLLSLLLALGAWATAMAAIYRMDTGLGLFGAVDFWHGSFFLVHSTLSALVLGGALYPQVILLGQWLRGGEMSTPVEKSLEGMRRFQVLMILLLMAYVLVSMAAGSFLASSATARATASLMAGPLSVNFWLFELGIGMLLPVFLLLSRSRCSPVRVGLAGLLAIVGQFFMHYDRVIVAQLASLPEGAPTEGLGLTSYLPCLPKVSAVLGALSLFLFLWSFLEKMRPQDAD